MWRGVNLFGMKLTRIRATSGFATIAAKELYESEGKNTKRLHSLCKQNN